METFSALLALCEGNSPVTGEFPEQRPVTRSFDIFICAWINGWVNNRKAGELTRRRAHYDVTGMIFIIMEQRPMNGWKWKTRIVLFWQHHPCWTQGTQNTASYLDPHPNPIKQNIWKLTSGSKPPYDIFTLKWFHGAIITPTQVIVYHWWIPCETLVHTGSR